MDVSLGATAVTAAAVAVTTFIRYLIVRAALKGTEPKDRAIILRSLATMFRTEWHLGPLRRERLRHTDEPSANQANQKDIGGSGEVTSTDGT